MGLAQCKSSGPLGKAKVNARVAILLTRWVGLGNIKYASNSRAFEFFVLQLIIFNAYNIVRHKNHPILLNRHAFACM